MYLLAWALLLMAVVAIVGAVVGLISICLSVVRLRRFERERNDSKP